MSQRAKYLLWLFVALLVFFGGGFWFISNFELVEKTIRTAAQEEARKNPFLAAERFLNKNQIETENTKLAILLKTLPPNTDAVLLSSRQNNKLLTTERQNSLRDWVENGGHLIIISHHFWNDEKNSSDDPFLDSLGIQKHRQSLSADELKELSPVDTHFFNDDEMLTINFRSQSYLLNTEDAAYAGIGTKNGFYLLQVDHGDGLITIINDDRLWKNINIDDHDHALFLHNLIRQGLKINTPTKTWIVHDLNFPSLFSLILAKAPYALLTLGLLIIFSLWAAYNRFGPAIVFNHRIRRSLAEHIDACGRYHWQQDEASGLLASLREQLDQALETRHPHWRKLPQQQQLEWLSQRSNRTIATLMSALNEQPQTEKEFTNIIRTLQQLRTTL